MRGKRHEWKFAAGLLLVASIFVGCSGGGTGGSQGGPSGGGGAPTPAPAPTPTPTPTSTLTPTPVDGLVSVSPTIQHVLGSRQYQRVVDYVAHDPRYPYKTAWGECVTLSAAQSGATTARCEIRRFVLLEFNAGSIMGAGRTAGDAEFSHHTANNQELRCDLQQKPNGSYFLPQNATCVGANFQRAVCANGACTVDWYADSDPQDGNAGTFYPGTNMTVVGGSLIVDAALRPDKVAHWWTNDRNSPNWLTPSASGKTYVIEIEFRTVGAAAVRVGLDRYTGTSQQYLNDCNWAGTNEAHNSCDDYNSDWYQTVGDSWRTVRLPVF